MGTTKGQKYKTFDDLIKVAIGHEKLNYYCDIIPSCSFTGRKFDVRSSLNKKQRNNISEKGRSIDMPNYLNYGYTQPVDGTLKKMKSVKVSLAIIMVLTGVVIGAYFGLSSLTTPSTT